MLIIMKMTDQSHNMEEHTNYPNSRYILRITAYLYVYGFQVLYYSVD